MQSKADIPQFKQLRTVDCDETGNACQIDACGPRKKKYEPKNKNELAPIPRDYLNLAGVEAEGIIKETKTLIVVQAVTCTMAELPVCMKCNSNAAVIKGQIRCRNISDVEQDGKLVQIVLKYQRYSCQTCGIAFTPPLPFLDSSGSQRTSRLTAKTKRLSDERRTTSDVSVLTGLSRRNVQAIAADVEKTRPTPQEVFSKVAACVIQIDDSHPSTGTCSAILLNGKPWELLETYEKLPIETLFISLEHREKVKIYVSDSAPFLIDLGRKYFPSALIVADPYHVVKRILKCFDELLKPFEARMVSEYASAIAENRLVRPIRAKRKIRKQSSNTDKISEPRSGEIRILLRTKIKRLTTVQKDAVRFLMQRFPELRAGYCHLQLVLKLYHTKISPTAASEALDKFEAMLPAETCLCFLEFLDFSRKHRDEICAFWGCGWSNAEAEAQNRVIKEIDRRGLDFPELRRRWLHGKSTSVTLERNQSSIRSDTSHETGPKKKEIRELRTLPPPEPVPVVGFGGEAWLFDLAPRIRTP